MRQWINIVEHREPINELFDDSPSLTAIPDAELPHSGLPQLPSVPTLKAYKFKVGSERYAVWFIKHSDAVECLFAKFVPAPNGTQTISFELTPSASAVQVFSAVMVAINTFCSTVRPETIVFPGWNARQSNFYKRLARYADKTGVLSNAYELYTHELDGKEITAIRKKVTPKAFEDISEDVSPGFKAWFGDSKVVDEHGNPLKVYHGTNQPLTKFSKDRGGAATGPRHGAAHGFFFTKSPVVASMYAVHAGTTNIAGMEDHEQKSAQYQKEIAAAERKGDWDRYEQLMSDYEDHEINATREDPIHGQNVIPAYLSLQHPKILNYQGGSGGTFSVHGDLDVVIDQAKAEGYDGLIMLNVDDTPSDSVVTDHYVAFSPKQIKSVFNGSFNPNSDHISETSRK
jgi:hypothetical protein